ncbi:hypothetical protein CRUP_026264 [Coryphaenoides rupestris]|nr:hypothetical protein CRUP_026264 [Coryphaenoides rupestris]
MNSLGKSAKWPSYDSLSSTHSLLLTVTLGSSSVTPGDTAFAQKKFVRPLLELLNGLKRGRFEKGFQQSVAMDRLQRILGILQKPDMGEKYLHTLLQVEILLRMWFPPMVPQSSIPPAHVHATLGPLRSRHNQLHIPPGKRHQSGDLLDFGQMVTSNNVISTQRPGTSAQKRDTEEITSGLPVRKLTDSSGALDDWRHSCSRRENETWRCLEISPPPSLCGNPATQDGSVSSSCTAVPTADSLSCSQFSEQVVLACQCEKGRAVNDITVEASSVSRE